MSERKTPLSHLKPETAKFLLDAYYDGALDKFAEAAEHSPKLARSLNALTIYFYLPNTTLEDTGKILSPTKPLSRERARQLVTEGVDELKAFGSDEFRDRFTGQVIPIRKPMPLARRVQRSVALGGRTARAAAMALEGTDSEQIRDELGYGFNGARRTAEGWGVNIENIPSRNSSPEEIEARIKTLSDPNEPLNKFEGMVKDLTRGQCVYLASRKIAFSIADLCGISGLHCRAADFEPVRQALLGSGVHMATFFRKVEEGKNAGLAQRYDYLFKRELDVSVNTLKTDSSLNPLRENPVRQVAGITVDSPTTNEMVHSPDYVAVTSITNALGVKIGKQGHASVEEFVDSPDCPPIFNYKKSYKFVAADTYAFRMFVRRRRRELGI